MGVGGGGGRTFQGLKELFPRRLLGAKCLDFVIESIIVQFHKGGGQAAVDGSEIRHRRAGRRRLEVR